MMMISDNEINQIRSETPGCKNVIHFNNAGAALVSDQVLNTTINYLNLEAQIGAYEAASQTETSVQQVYDSISTLIGATTNEVAIIENATRAWDMAFYSIPFSKGDKVLISRSEYASNYIALLQVSQQKGIILEVIPDDESGQISIPHLCNAIDKKVRLIALTHIPSNGGLINPADTVGKIAQEAGVLYLLDACQSIGQIPINVEDIKCHMLSATGRKYLRGPRGIGFLYVRSNIINKLKPPFLDLHSAYWIKSGIFAIRSDAKRFETWETNYATKLGLGAAVNYAMKWNIERTWSRIKFLAEYFRTQLAAFSKVRLHDKGATLSGIISFSVAGKEPKFIKHSLSNHSINVSVSSKDYTPIDMEIRGIKSLIRASVHYYNTIEEIDRFCDILGSII